MPAPAKVTGWSRLLNLFSYSLRFYLDKLSILVIFSIPMLLAFMILLLVPAPTFITLGFASLRTGSLPDLGLAEVLLTAAAYLISLFLISDTLANINLVIKSRRTFTLNPSEIWAALSTYAVRILYVYTFIMLLFTFIHLLTFEQPIQALIYPAAVFVLSYLFFFVTPAIVIDNAHVLNAFAYSASMALKKPILFLVWVLTGTIMLSAVRLILGIALPSFASPLSLIINAVFILPFLIILQTNMYLEKYPLAH